MMGIVVPETCWASKKICNKNQLLYSINFSAECCLQNCVSTLKPKSSLASHRSKVYYTVHRIPPFGPVLGQFNHHHHHQANMELGHLLTRSVLTCLEVSWKVSLVSSACWSVDFGILDNLLLGILFNCCKQFLLYSCILSKLRLYWSLLQSLCLFYNLSKRTYRALFLIYFISAAVIFLRLLY